LKEILEFILMKKLDQNGQVTGIIPGGLAQRRVGYLTGILGLQSLQKEELNNCRKL
jgi:hypothetical protein